MNCVICIAQNKPETTAEVGCACRACFTRVDHNLDELADLYMSLPGALVPLRAASSGRRAAPGPRLSVSLDALSLLGPGSVEATKVGGVLPPEVLLRKWTDRWATAKPERMTVVALVERLRNKLFWAAENTEDFDVFATEVRVCVAAVRRATGLSEGLDRWLIGYCPNRIYPEAAFYEGQMCYAPLYASAWDERICCSNCTTVYPRSGGGWVRLKERLEEEDLAA